jgi:hypothetical protein
METYPAWTHGVDDALEYHGVDASRGIDTASVEGRRSAAGGHNEPFLKFDFC